MGLVSLVVVAVVLCGLGLYVLVPFLVQQGVERIGSEKKKRPPVFNEVSVLEMDDKGLSLRLSLLLPLPTRLHLPLWFNAGLANNPTLTLSRRRSKRHGGHVQPLLKSTLSNLITVPGGVVDALALEQDNLRVELINLDLLRKLVRRVTLQLQQKDAHLDDIIVNIDTRVDIQVMGMVLWTDVHLHRDINLAPLIEQIRNDPKFTESHKNAVIPPPVFVPDYLSLSDHHSSEDISATAATGVPGPLHLYNIGHRATKKNIQPSSLDTIESGQREPGIEGLFPGLKLNTLPQTTTPQGILRGGIRATFGPPGPALHLRIAKIEFRVKINGEVAALGLVEEFRLGNGGGRGAVEGGGSASATTTPMNKKGGSIMDLNVAVTPTIVNGGASGLVKGAIGGARGFFKGVLAGALSGLNGGEFGDGSTVVEIVDLQVFVFTESRSVVSVPWIRDIAKSVDLLLDVNPIKAIGNNVDAGVIVEVAASFMLARGCSVM